jgi:hypothetical protein
LSCLSLRLMRTLLDMWDDCREMLLDSSWMLPKS